MTAREMLIAEAVYHDGDWSKIVDALSKKEYLPEEEINRINKSLKCHAITIVDDNYPLYLKQMFRPPIVLFYEGDISLLESSDKCLAVVGTRNPSELGVKMTRKIVEEVSQEFIIVSGLASGIDRTAHLSAMNSGGRTIAVLGSGIDYCFPSENRDIFKRIKRDHLLVSEYPPGSPPKSERFPIRNRLIAMFSKGILITESKIKSGTSITASYGLEYGKEVMCLPSSDYDDSGCNRFIKAGASLVENAEDVLFVMK